jgi:predicted GNAT family acetyltransferase
MAPELTDAADGSRLELRDQEELLGWLDYLPAGESVVLAHTEVAEGHEGEGLAGTIVRAALGRFAESGKTVIPTCPFAAAYIARHPELGRFVDPRLRQDAEAG